MSGHGCSPGLGSFKVESLLAKMSVLRIRQESPPPQEELQSRFNSIRTSTSDSDIPSDHHDPEPDISHFVSDVNFQYVDFARRQDEFSTFRVQDFNWDEEGYSSIARSYLHAKCYEECLLQIYIECSSLKMHSTKVIKFSTGLMRTLPNAWMTNSEQFTI